MSKCQNCVYFFRDYQAGYSECTKVDDFTDEEYEEIELNEDYEKCPYYTEDFGGFDYD